MLPADPFIESKRCIGSPGRIKTMDQFIEKRKNELAVFFKKNITKKLKIIPKNIHQQKNHVKNLKKNSAA